MNKFSLTFLFLIAVMANLHCNGLSLSLSESIRTPLDKTKPTDYQFTFATKYDDNVDIYYAQERNEGISELEYWVGLQGQTYKSIWLSGKRQESKQSDLWLADIKFNIEKSGWKTFIGYSNCWNYGIYEPKILLEESKRVSFNFFLTPFTLDTSVKLLADTEQLFHEEKIEFKFLINLPTSWKANKYINTYIKLFVLSKDYGYFNWQQKLMLEVNFK